MGQTCCERWPIVESILGSSLGKFYTCFESIYPPPECDHFLLLLGEVERRGHYVRFSEI